MVVAVPAIAVIVLSVVLVVVSGGINSVRGRSSSTTIAVEVLRVMLLVAVSYTHLTLPTILRV